MRKRLNTYLIVAALCIMPGLAPFSPEPHLFGKVRWLLGDPSTMQALDWFDLLMHASPFLVLGYLLIGDLQKRLAQK